MGFVCETHLAFASPHPVVLVVPRRTLPALRRREALRAHALIELRPVRPLLLFRRLFARRRRRWQTLFGRTGGERLAEGIGVHRRAVGGVRQRDQAEGRERQRGAQAELAEKVLLHSGAPFEERVGLDAGRRRPPAREEGRRRDAALPCPASRMEGMHDGRRDAADTGAPVLPAIAVVSQAP